MPLRDGLLFVNSALRGVGLRDEIRLIAAGKVSTGFHIVRALALGADLCNAARAMMFAIGCIQALRCNTNQCPVGVATQDPSRNNGLVVADKGERVYRYHRDTIAAFLELISANGLSAPGMLRPRNLLGRVSPTEIKTFADVYEYLDRGCLLDNQTVPPAWRELWSRARPDAFDTAPWSMLPKAPVA
jgi:glutamate synthase domain-containing protein 2